MKKLMYILAILASCATNTKLPVNGNSVPSTENQLHTSLIHINLLSIVIASVATGLGIYGMVSADSLLERIALIVAIAAGILVVVSLTGLFLLPYSPWIIGGVIVTGIGSGGIILYEKYKAH